MAGITKIGLGVALPIFAGAVQAQGAPHDELRAVLAVAATVRDSGKTWGAAIWPGYRPDTIPLIFVLPGRGTALVNWSGTAPDGYQTVADLPGLSWKPEAARGAASTGTELAGRAAAQIVVQNTERASLTGLVLHEAFHVFASSQRRDGRRFGRGENAALVSSYPVFDEPNETGMLLEGRLLAGALRASSATAARQMSRQYSAARERRTRTLAREFADFEEMTELNEGLAEYAQVRGELWGGARIETQREIRHLDDLLGATERSFRLRYYSTGAAMALLLDRLTGPTWKARVMDENLTLAELLAQASGYHADEVASQRAADRANDIAALRSRARGTVETLRAQRRARVDSAFAGDGLVIELDGSALPQRFIGHCGFDPMNTLQVGDGTVLHTRWLALCGSGGRWRGEFNGQVLQSAGFTTLRALVGPDSTVTVTVRGAPVSLTELTRLAGAEDVQLQSPILTLHLSRADLERDGRTLRVRLPAP